MDAAGGCFSTQHSVMMMMMMGNLFFGQKPSLRVGVALRSISAITKTSAEDVCLRSSINWPCPSQRIPFRSLSLSVSRHHDRCT